MSSGNAAQQTRSSFLIGYLTRYGVAIKLNFEGHESRSGNGMNMPRHEDAEQELTPAAIDDAVSLVLSRLPDDLKSRVAACETSVDVYALDATHLIGTRIRNELALWNENHQLASQFPLATHPDSMSTEILIECWKRLRLPRD